MIIIRSLDDIFIQARYVSELGTAVKALHHRVASAETACGNSGSELSKLGQYMNALGQMELQQVVVFLMPAFQL